MGGLLYKGQWTQKHKWAATKDGDFNRQKSSFRDNIENDARARFASERDRYHLYVSLACPWANRTLIVRNLLGLQSILPVSIVHYLMLENGWIFDSSEDPDSTEDHLHGAKYLHEIYTRANAEFSGRVTVPVLWDKSEGTIVNNESSEIIRMLSTQMNHLGTNNVDLYPDDLRAAIDFACDEIYQPINNGVYLCGFAQTQDAYDRAFTDLFECLDQWDDILGQQRFLCGDRFTLADICMFTTLVRFDPVYYVHFKCNQQLIEQYEHISGYLRELYGVPEIRETVNIHHIKQHYFRSHTHINPNQIVPQGPHLDLDYPHGREHLKGYAPWL